MMPAYTARLCSALCGGSCPRLALVAVRPTHAPSFRQVTATVATFQVGAAVTGVATVNSPRKFSWTAGAPGALGDSPHRLTSYHCVDGGCVLSKLISPSLSLS